MRAARHSGKVAGDTKMKVVPIPISRTVSGILNRKHECKGKRLKGGKLVCFGTTRRLNGYCKNCNRNYFWKLKKAQDAKKS